MLKVIEIPDTVATPDGTVKYTDLARACLDDARYGVGIEAAERRVRTRKALKEAEDSGQLRLQYSDWQVFCDAMLQPLRVVNRKTEQAPWPPAINEAILPYMIATRDARDEQDEDS